MISNISVFTRNYKYPKFLTRRYVDSINPQYLNQQIIANMGLWNIQRLCRLAAASSRFVALYLGCLQFTLGEQFFWDSAYNPINFSILSASCALQFDHCQELTLLQQDKKTILPISLSHENISPMTSASPVTAIIK